MIQKGFWPDFRTNTMITLCKSDRQRFIEWILVEVGPFSDGFHQAKNLRRYCKYQIAFKNKTIKINGLSVGFNQWATPGARLYEFYGLKNTGLIIHF